LTSSVTKKLRRDREAVRREKRSRSELGVEPSRPAVTI
jgi:hypothetical protein